MSDDFRGAGMTSEARLTDLENLKIFVVEPLVKELVVVLFCVSQKTTRISLRVIHL